MNLFEKKIGLNYKFNNSLLLAEAFTHPSLSNELIGCNLQKFDYQRLEFLGDSVLQLVISQKLFELFPHADEGTLTKIRAFLVSENKFAEIAKKIKLDKYVCLGKGEEELKGRQRPALLADVFEALIGAIYIDSNFEITKKFILNLLKNDLRSIKKILPITTQKAIYKKFCNLRVFTH